MAIESLVGRPIVEEEQISMLTVPVPPTPEWLKTIQQDMKEKGLDCLTTQEIDAEIAAARRERRERDQRAGR